MTMISTDDLRVTEVRPVIPPVILLEEMPVSDAAAQLVTRSRRELQAILEQRDSRMVAVVGPCSIHDPQAALEYGERLAREARRFEDDLLVIMRVYFEKPRTTVGWKGMINDPHMDGSFAINDGLRAARALLMQLLEIGVPCGTEFLDTISPQFIADLISWGAIGARTTESQVHRELASGLSMPVGFKNGTDGNFQIAVDAISAAARPHHFLSVTKQGLVAAIETQGNERCHVILRGSSRGPNFDRESVATVAAALARAGHPARIMIDASHGNSNKDYRNQPHVAGGVAEQLTSGNRSIFGLMLESHLVAGRQDYKPGVPGVYGQSITDACLGFDDSVAVLHELARAVRARRASGRPVQRNAGMEQAESVPAD